MLLFNHKKEFIGIDSKYLQLFGYKSLSDLLEDVNDFSDLFVKKPGYIHNFKHVNWIDFVQCADSQESAKVLIHANSRHFQCYMSLSIIHMTDSPSSQAYQINLSNIQELTDNETKYISVDLLEQSTPVPTPVKIVPVVEPVINFVAPEEDSINIETLPSDSIDDFNSDEPLDLNFDDAFDEKEVPKIEDTQDYIHQEERVEIELDPEPILEEKFITKNEIFDNGYIFDPLIASSELGLPVDLIEEFIEDFIAQAIEFKDEIYQAWENEDDENIKILSHKLKGVAANLRIEDALESLGVINTSTSTTEIKTELDTFYNIIAKLSGETIEVIVPIEVTPKAVHAVDNEIELNFKDDVVSEQPEPQEELSLELDDLELDFKDDVVSEQPEPQEELSLELDELELDFKDDVVSEQPEPQEELSLELDNLELDFKDDVVSEQPEPIEEALEILPTITYNKERVASEIGLDKESFDELFQDYLLEAQDLSKSISTAIEIGNAPSWKHLAFKFKGMSDNMRVKDFTKELETLINAEDVSIAKETNKYIIQCITQLLKIKE